MANFRLQCDITCDTLGELVAVLTHFKDAYSVNVLSVTGYTKTKRIQVAIEQGTLNELVAAATDILSRYDTDIIFEMTQ